MNICIYRYIQRKRERDEEDYMERERRRDGERERGRERGLPSTLGPAGRELRARGGAEEELLPKEALADDAKHQQRKRLRARVPL